MRIRILAQAVLAALVGLSATAQIVKVDPKVSAYKKVPGISGNLNSIGSDTLNNLMAYWVEGFNKKYPNVKIQVEGKGSTTAPPALIESTSQRQVRKEVRLQTHEGRCGHRHPGRICE